MPPVCSPLQDVTRVIEINTAPVAVFWQEPTATDNSLQPVMLVSRSSAPGDEFNVGTTPVIYIFADDAGNQVTCTFNVIIEEGKL